MNAHYNKTYFVIRKEETISGYVNQRDLSHRIPNETLARDIYNKYAAAESGIFLIKITETAISLPDQISHQPTEAVLKKE